MGRLLFLNPAIRQFRAGLPEVSTLDCATTVSWQSAPAKESQWRVECVKRWSGSGQSYRLSLDREETSPIVSMALTTMERVVKVSDQHVWVGVEDRYVYLGLTNYGQSELGTVISVDIPDVGDKIEQGEIFAELELVSTVHELISPVSGTVIAVNSDLENHPSVINDDPYIEGWIVEVRLNDESEVCSLMDMDEYDHFVFGAKS